MPIRILFAVLTAMFLVTAPSQAESLPRSTPEAQGVSSDQLLKFVTTADEQLDSLHSVMVVRHGQVVMEGWWAPYSAERPHELYSLTKSFTSTAVGLAIASGKLSLDDPVLKFFPDQAPAEPSERLQALKVRHLLMMSVGHRNEVPFFGETELTKAFLAHPIASEPGSTFLYNTPASYMLSAIVQKVTGETEEEYLKQRLFDPLGIEGYTWLKSPEGVSIGGYGLSVRTEDIAKFGQLYLQHGQWHGEQLVPKDWVEQATSKQISNGDNPQSDWAQGYGFQFWRCRHDSYRGDGAFGQFCIVMPEQDTVVAITSGLGDMQGVLNVVWDQLLPALKEGELPANDQARQNLQSQLAALMIDVPEGQATSPTGDRIDGKTFEFDKNSFGLESLQVSQAGANQPLQLTMQVNGKRQQLHCGFENWQETETAWGPLPEQPIAASAAWTSENELSVKVCLVTTPFITSATLKFNGDKVTYHARQNVNFGPSEYGPFTGRMKE